MKPARQHGFWADSPVDFDETKKMQSPYAGMTLNERIVVSGQLREWDQAVHAADRAKMVEILVHLDLDTQAEALADQILKRETCS